MSSLTSRMAFVQRQLQMIKSITTSIRNSDCDAIYEPVPGHLEKSHISRTTYLESESLRPSASSCIKSSLVMPKEMPWDHRSQAQNVCRPGAVPSCSVSIKIHPTKLLQHEPSQNQALHLLSRGLSPKARLIYHYVPFESVPSSNRIATTHHYSMPNHEPEGTI